jgi:adenosylcobinamide-phosphate synthase
MLTGNERSAHSPAMDLFANLTLAGFTLADFRLAEFREDYFWIWRIALLLGGLTLDAIIGDPRWFYRLIPHPVMWFGAVITLMERWFNPPYEGPLYRFVAGTVTTLFVIGLAGALGAVIALVSISFEYGWIAELVLVGVMVAQRDLFAHVRRVRKALAVSVEAGRAEVSQIVGRDPESLDKHAVARAAIETLAENFSDGVVAPALAFLAFGPIGLTVYKAINTLDSMIGHRSVRYRWFGKTAARLDDVANLIPARVSGLLLAFAALFTPTANPFRAVRTMFRDASKHRSPNAGWPEAAMAGALDLALAGPRRYGDEVVRDDWIGEGRARATPVDISRALTLFALACTVQALLLIAGIGALFYFH